MSEARPDVRSGLIGLTMSFRIAAMLSTLLEQLQVIGKNKAGWLRGSNFIRGIS